MVLLVEKNAILGRRITNDLNISEGDVSKIHAEIVFKENNFYIKDLGSLMGTYLRLKPG